MAITLRSRIRGSNRLIPSSSCPRRSDATIGLTRRRPDAQYNKAAWLRQAPFSEMLSRLCRGCRLLQPLSDIGGFPRLNQLTEVAIHYPLQNVKREVDPVIP